MITANIRMSQKRKSMMTNANIQDTGEDTNETPQEFTSVHTYA